MTPSDTTRETVVEKVARAIWLELMWRPEAPLWAHEQEWDAPWAPDRQWMRDTCTAQARAALAAIRERLDPVANDHWTGPREAVAEVGVEYVRGFNAACADHKRLIDQALSEGQDG